MNKKKKKLTWLIWIHRKKYPAFDRNKIKIMCKNHFSPIKFITNIVTFCYKRNNKNILYKKMNRNNIMIKNYHSNVDGWNHFRFYFYTLCYDCDEKIYHYFSIYLSSWWYIYNDNRRYEKENRSIARNINVVTV